MVLESCILKGNEKEFEGGGVYGDVEGWSSGEGVLL